MAKLQLLLRFLKENRILTKFINNYYNCWSITMTRGEYEPLHSFIEFSNPSVYITNSFDWRRTKEGHDFWSIVHWKWIDFLKKWIN